MTETSPLLFLIHVYGAVALLLWSVRLVRTGVERGWIISLRALLRRGAENRWIAAMIGCAAAVLLQSSTAVAILTTNFVTSGTLSSAQALAMMLGSDVGSAIVAQLLTTRAFWLVPALLIPGVFLFSKGQQRNARMLGRILIGLALIFVSLSMLREATEPLRHSPLLVNGMKYLGSDPMTAFVIGAGLAWMMHSSVAAVLLFITLAAQDLLSMSGGVAMMLGANFGGAALAFTLTLDAELTARRVIVANVIMRGGGALITLLMIVLLTPSFEAIGASPAQQILNLHLIFNLALALLSLPLIKPILKVVSVWVRKSPGHAALERVSALDPATISAPDRALACAMREILIMGEIVAGMMRSVIVLYGRWNDDTAAAIRSQEAEFNRMHMGLKLFLAKVQQSANDEGIDRRAHEQAEMATNLSGACHAIADPLVSFARRLDQTGNRFSTTGMDEIRDFHDRVLTNVQTALNVVMTCNPEEARLLVEEKDRLRDYEQQLQRSHLDRIRNGLQESIETSAVHQETLRTIKQINSSFSMLAYPILDQQGILMSSRLSQI